MPAPNPVSTRWRVHLGAARAPRAEVSDADAAPVAEAAATSEVLAVASLARAVSGEATIADVGALTWMMLRQVVPCTSMAIFLYEDKLDAVAVQYADGAHAALVRGTRLTARDWRRRLVCGQPPVRAERGPGDGSGTNRGDALASAAVVGDRATGAGQCRRRRTVAVWIDERRFYRRPRETVDTPRPQPGNLDCRAAETGGVEPDRRGAAAPCGRRVQVAEAVAEQDGGTESTGTEGTEGTGTEGTESTGQDRHGGTEGEPGRVRASRGG